MKVFLDFIEGAAQYDFSRLRFGHGFIGGGRFAGQCPQQVGCQHFFDFAFQFSCAVDHGCAGINADRERHAEPLLDHFGLLQKARAYDGRGGDAEFFDHR